MSIESQLGRRVYELKGVLQAGVFEELLECTRENDFPLTQQQLVLVKTCIDNSIEKIVDRGTHNILSVLKK
ncbi:hypothetical protein CL614_04505 [archaeon]|jgi:hypothetical protein|nr:hypothetical protein [archaeon]|tara:strand:- start:1091 stop:1303 length:213 start_codon:yes stop_codon:yes gene_type:complete